MLEVPKPIQATPNPAENANKVDAEKIDPYANAPESLRELHETIAALADNPLEGASKFEIRALAQMRRLAHQILDGRKAPNDRDFSKVEVTKDHRSLRTAADSLSKKIPKEEGRDHALFSTLAGALQNLASLKCPPSLEVKTVESLEEIRALLEGISPSFLEDQKEKNRLNSALQGIRGMLRDKQNGGMRTRRGSRGQGQSGRRGRGNARGRGDSRGRGNFRGNSRGRGSFRGRNSAPNFLLKPNGRGAGGQGYGRGAGNRGYSGRGAGNQGYGGAYNAMNQGYVHKGNPYMNSQHMGPYQPYDNDYSQQTGFGYNNGY